MQTCARITTSSAQTTHTERAKSWLAPVALQSRRQVRCLANTPVCAGCVTGSLDAGTPKGIDTTIAGVDCYLSRPQNPNGHALILATDIFGNKLINARLIADVFAENGYLTVIPDYFRNDALDIKMLELSESLPSQSLLGKIGTYAQLAGQIVGMASWFPRHPVSHAVEVVTAAAAALRADHGIKNIGVQGYCYGGKVCALMAAKPDVVNSVCTAHPSILKVPDDIQAMKVPALFLCAETDAQFAAHKRSAAMQASQQTAPGRDTYILYKGTNHGFAVRGNKADPAVNAAREDALQQGVNFFHRTLCGVSATEEQDASKVGVLLTSA